MKYSTLIVYGIPPKDLANMRHVDALRACKAGGIKRLNQLTHKSPNQANWCKRRTDLIKYIGKAVKWQEMKLNEMGA